MIIDKQFEKETFKKSVRDNVRFLFSKDIGRGDSSADLSGSFLFCKRCNH